MTICKVFAQLDIMQFNEMVQVETDMVNDLKSLKTVHSDSVFSLYSDTILVDIKGEISHALKYCNKFYVLYWQRHLFDKDKRWLCIYSNNKLERVVNCPQKLDVTYLDFFVKNGRIIIKPNFDGQCYYLDTNKFIWKKIKKADDLIFEDEKFYVYSLDFGEWGGKTWFKEKKTGKEYEIETTAPLINKIDTAYYLTQSFRVLKIEPPFELNKCDDDFTYENIKTDNRYTYWYGERIGFDTVYNATYGIDYFDFSYRTRIITSFVWKNELLHISEIDSVIYIAKAEGNLIAPIQKIGERMDFYNWHYSYRCRNLNGNNELLKFRTKDEKLFGLMEVLGNNVYLHYFKNN
jgi:hypothetical protein